jgi:hypothetical protein
MDGEVAEPECPGGGSRESGGLPRVSHSRNVA